MFVAMAERRQTCQVPVMSRGDNLLVSFLEKRVGLPLARVVLLPCAVTKSGRGDGLCVGASDPRIE